MHFTTGRLTECEQCIAPLLANSGLEPRVHIALRAIQVADSLALDETDLASRRVDALVETIANKPKEFKVNWSFKSVKYFIGYNEKLVPYRPWLTQFFAAVEGDDRDAVLSALREVRTTLPAALMQ